MTLVRAFLTVVLLAFHGGSWGDGIASKISWREFYCDDGRLALRIGKSLRELQSLPLLRNETVEPVDTYGAETHVLNFAGLTIRVIFPEQNYEKGVIEGASITSRDWSIAGGVRVGWSLKRLSATLKTKLKPGTPSVKVCGDTDCVVYSIKNDRVTGIEYQCYTG